MKPRAAFLRGRAARRVSSWCCGAVLLGITCMTAVATAAREKSPSAPVATKPAEATAAPNTQAAVMAVGAETAQTKTTDASGGQTNGGTTPSAQPREQESSGATAGRETDSSSSQRRQVGSDDYPSTWLVWAALLLALVGLLAAAAAVFLAWRSEGDLQRADDQSRRLTDKMDSLRREIEQFKKETYEHMEKFDGDADRVSNDLSVLSARVKKLEMVKLPLEPAPKSQPPLRQHDSLVGRPQAAEQNGGNGQLGAKNAAPVHASKSPILLLQEAADAALSEELYPNSAAFTNAVLAKLPPDVVERLRLRQRRVAGHNSTASLREDYSRPDFISAVGPNGAGVLLPCRSAAYALSYINVYEGPMESWPNVAIPAECHVDASGDVKLVKKGTLA